MILAGGSTKEEPELFVRFLFYFRLVCFDFVLICWFHFVSFFFFFFLTALENVEMPIIFAGDLAADESRAGAVCMFFSLVWLIWFGLVFISPFFLDAMVFSSLRAEPLLLLEKKIIA